MSTRTAKRYPAVGPFEKATSFCPLYLADSIVDEVSHYVKAPLPETLADDLAERAERVFIHQPHYRRLVKGRNGRGWIRCFMRHWLASTLQKKHPRWYRQLPDSYKTGQPLPVTRPELAKPAVKTRKKRAA